MKLENLLKARFLERLNRFVGVVELEGRRERVLIRNTGRMRELLTPDKEVYLKSKSTGKYAYELFLVKEDSSLVCVDSHLATGLFLEWAKREGYPCRVKQVKREPKGINSRFDLLINGKWLIEVKSVNLVRDGVALFPDAPTRRGTRHLRELVELSSTYEPLLVFVVLREDARSFSPNCSTDPKFCEAFRYYVSKGLGVKVLRCEVSLGSIEVSGEIPVSQFAVS